MASFTMFLFPLILVHRGLGVWAQSSSSGGAVYSAMTTTTMSAPPVPTTATPSLAPMSAGMASPPAASAYVLNSSFEINSDAVTRTFDWTLSVQTGAPDGYQRNQITINGQYPGPLIEANEGDTVVVNVMNQLSSENLTTTIHWHGIYMEESQYMDGVPGVTQCPLQPGQSFTYTFKLNQYGTYWYHSHSGVQYTDGLLGPLIVHSVNDPLVRGTDFDYEQVLVVNDWYHEEANTIAAELLSSSGYLNSFAAPSPQSGLVNGRGVFNCSLLDDDTANCTTPTSFPVFNVESNAKTRFRLINAGSHAQFSFSVDEHTVTVVEADGTPVSGSGDLHRVPFHNGQRYSAIVDTTVGSEGDGYWMRFEMNTNCFASIDPTLNSTVYAILRYGNSSDSDTNPTTSDWSDILGDSCVDLDDSLLVPLVSQDANSSDAVVVFDSEFGTVAYGNDTYGRFFINNTTFVDYAYKPILEGIASSGTDYINSSAVTAAIFDDSIETGDIIINNLDPALDHPYHLHGYEFQIVARGSGTLDVAGASNIVYNTTNPLRRDTLVIPGGSYAVLRITNDNPGAWILHCHIAWHLAEGFLGIVVSKPNAIASISFPSIMEDLCDQRPDSISVNSTEIPRRRRALDGRTRFN